MATNASADTLKMSTLVNVPSNEAAPLLKRCSAKDAPAADVRDTAQDALDAEWRNEVYGYSLLLMSTLCYSIMTLCMRAATAYHGVAPLSMAFMRGLTQMCTALIIIFGFMDYRKAFDLSPRLIFGIAVRSIFGGIAMALLFVALSMAPLGTVMSVFFLNPIITLLLSVVVLGESIGYREVLAALISFTGVVLVSNPELSFSSFLAQSREQTLGIGLALLSSVCVSIAFITIRYMGTAVSFMTGVLSFGAFLTIVGWFIGGTKNIGTLASNPIAAWLTLLTCVSGFLGQCLVSKGFQHCRVGVGSLLRNANVPAAYLLAILFLGEIPRPVTLLGSALVVIGTLLAGLEKLFGKRRKIMEQV